MEVIGYILISIVVFAWIIAMFIGIIHSFPYGIIGLIAITGFGLLFIKVMKERLSSQEDRYYSKNIEK